MFSGCAGEKSYGARSFFLKHLINILTIFEKYNIIYVNTDNINKDVERMTKYLCIELNVQNLPAEGQYRFFLKYIRFTDKIQCERIDDLIYISYDDEDPVAMRVIQRLPRYFLRGFRIAECSEHPFQKDQAAEIRLPIEENIDSTLFPYISMFLPVILGKRQYESWYYCNFINVMCVNEVGFYNYTDDRSCFKRILSENSAQYIKPLHFTKEVFISALFEEYYIYVWIDSCYSGDWDGNHDTHEAHPILIYGVNTDENVYYCYRFSPLKGVFACTYDIDMVHLSIESARCEIGNHLDDSHISIFRPKELSQENLFDRSRFLRELENYTFSTGDKIKEYGRAEVAITDSKKICFGLDVTENVIRLLKGEVQNSNFDYRIIHLITEHKWMLLKRLQYVKDLFSILDARLNQLLFDYEQLAKRYELMKNYFIKQSMIQSGGQSFYAPPVQESARFKMINTYEELLRKEKALLEELYQILSIYLLLCDPDDSGSNYYFSAQKAGGRDERGAYQSLSWDEPIETRKIYIRSLCGRDPLYCSGTVVLSDGERAVSYQPEFSAEHEAELIFPSLQKMKSMKFYPEKYLTDKNGNLLAGFKIMEDNKLNQASEIIASSVFQVEGLDCSAENMIREDSQFWCPDRNDRERCVVFSFASPISFNCCVLAEDWAALRVTAYKIEYCCNGRWETILAPEEPIGRLPVRKHFQRVVGAEKVRFSVIRSVCSPNGFDLPNITKFELYDRICI